MLHATGGLDSGWSVRWRGRWLVFVMLLFEMDVSLKVETRKQRKGHMYTVHILLPRSATQNRSKINDEDDFSRSKQQH